MKQNPDPTGKPERPALQRDLPPAPPELSDIEAKFERGDTVGAVEKLRVLVANAPPDVLKYQTLISMESRLRGPADHESIFYRTLEQLKGLEGSGPVRASIMEGYARALARWPETNDGMHFKFRVADARAWVKHAQTLRGDDPTAAAIADSNNGLISLELGQVGEAYFQLGGATTRVMRENPAAGKFLGAGRLCQGLAEAAYELELFAPAKEFAVAAEASRKQKFPSTHPDCIEAHLMVARCYLPACEDPRMLGSAVQRIESVLGTCADSLPYGHPLRLLAAAELGFGIWRQAVVEFKNTKQIRSLEKAFDRAGAIFAVIPKGPEIFLRSGEGSVHPGTLAFVSYRAAKVCAEFALLSRPTPAYEATQLAMEHVREGRELLGEFPDEPLLLAKMIGIEAIVRGVEGDGDDAIDKLAISARMGLNAASSASPWLYDTMEQLVIWGKQLGDEPTATAWRLRMIEHWGEKLERPIGAIRVEL